MCSQSIRTCQNMSKVSTQHNVISKQELCGSFWNFLANSAFEASANCSLSMWRPPTNWITSQRPLQSGATYGNMQGQRVAFFPSSGVDNGRWNKETKALLSISLFFLIHSSKKNLRLVVDPKHNNRLTLSSFKHGQLCFQHGTRSHKQNNDHTIQKHTNESMHNEHYLWTNIVWCAAKKWQTVKACRGMLRLSRGKQL